MKTQLCVLVLTTFGCQTAWEDPKQVQLDLYGRPVRERDHVRRFEPPAEAEGEPIDTTISGLVAGFSLSPWVAAGDPGSDPSATAIGDVTGDGRADVVVATDTGGTSATNYRVYVYAQRADGTLAPPTSYPYSATASRNGLLLVDLDENGLRDVVVGHGQGISVLLANGAGGLGTATVFTGGDSMALATLDVDRDGHADVVSLGWSRDSTIHFGNGAGGFARTETLVTNNAGYNDLEAGDVTGDGITDLVVMSGQGASPYVAVHAGLATGGFAPLVTYTGLSSAPSGIGIGDVTGDGRNDVVLSRGRNSPTYLWIMAQNFSGGLDAPTTITSYDIPETLEVADLDGDRLEDVIVLHAGWNRVGVYQQLDGGGLSAETRSTIPYASNYDPQALAIGDFSSDGCADIAIADYNQGLVVLYGQNCGSPSDTATHQPGWAAPICASHAVGCDSGVLLNGRAQIHGGAETLAPNTLDGCADGSAGRYRSDESIERIVVRASSGAQLTGGAAATVSVTTWAWNNLTGDQLDIFIAEQAGAPSWQLIATLPPALAGLQTLSIPVTLPVRHGFQAIRAQWRWNGQPNPCEAGELNDRDDLVFKVN